MGAQKKEAAEQLYENPYGRKFTSNEIRDILDREEKRIQDEEQALQDTIQKEIEGEDGAEDVATKSSGKDNSTPPKLFLGYALMVLVRTVIDALFIAYYFQVYSFTFVMPGTDQIILQG